ncbi:MAG: M23 family metallopeptidase [Gammaproteobacteria bacterium]|nr:MAG: M23 family metallopeptidase [Gammaproteobacteria bacterium]
MKFHIWILAALFSVPAFAAQQDLQLPPNLQQGQLVVGHAPRGVKIEYGGRRLRVGDDGVFVFGIDRDAPPQIKLHVRYSNGKGRDQLVAVAKREYHIERIEGLPQKTVKPDPETAKKIRAELARVSEAKHRDDAREDFLAGFRLPVEDARISGVFGSQRIDNGVPQSPHAGLDMAVPTGTPVHAPAAGVVSLADPDMILTGGTVLIDHGYGLSSALIHMSRLDVKTGDRIAAGQVIGLSGATGRASGPHVHWGFSWFDVRLDPALLSKPVAAANESGDP